MADTGSVVIGSPAFLDTQGNPTTDIPPEEIAWSAGPYVLVGARANNRNVNVTFMSLVRSGSEEVFVNTNADVGSEATFGFRLYAENDRDKTWGWQIRPDTREPYTANFTGGTARRYRNFYDSVRTTDSYVLLWSKAGVPDIPAAQANPARFQLGGVQHEALFSHGVEHTLLYLGGQELYRK